MWTSHDDVACVVSVNKLKKIYQSSPWFGHVGREFFINVAIKLFPIRIVVKDTLINIGTCGVVCESSYVWVFLQVCKDVVDCLKMSEPRIGLVLR
jgi:hypothetical protein